MEQSEEKIRKGMAAVLVMVLEDFDNPELSALYLAITGFGKVGEGVRGFKKAVERQVIKPSGHPWDEEVLTIALSHEIDRRVNAGTFTLEEEE